LGEDLGSWQAVHEEDRSYQGTLGAVVLGGHAFLVADHVVVVGEALQDELTNMFGEQHLVEIGQGECRVPNSVSLNNHHEN
jgi:hypothetical protein